MARVSHKKIKQLIAQKQSKITDRQFFTSRILAAHFADIAAGTDVLADTLIELANEI